MKLHTDNAIYVSLHAHIKFEHDISFAKPVKSPENKPLPFTQLRIITNHRKKCNYSETNESKERKIVKI